MRMSFEKTIAAIISSASIAALLLFIQLALGCTHQPPVAVPAAAANSNIMACLPNAIMLCEGLQEAGIESKVLSIYTERFGHAVVVYMYPKGKNQLWVWDAQWGSTQIRAYYNNPEQIAKAWLVWSGNYATLTSASFRE